MFTEKERLLANEASLTSSLLGNGLNALRKANINNKGLYYQAFFSLSIGVERLLKMIIITQYRSEHNGDFPVDIDMKKLSHNLIKLCQYTGIQFKKDSIHEKIVIFLDDFARKSRYYNIDSMVYKNVQYYDPLYEWSLIAEVILDSSGKRKEIKNKQKLSRLIDSVSLFRFYDLQGNEVNNAIGILNNIENQEIIQEYSVQYMFEIITKLVEEIRRLQDIKYMMPVLTEFFPLYNKYWKPYEIRKKKDWLRIS